MLFRSFCKTVYRFFCGCQTLGRLFFPEKLGKFFSDNPFSRLLPAVFVFIFAAVFVPVFGSFFLFLLPMILFLNASVNGAARTSLVFFFSFLLLLILAILLDLDVPAFSVFTLGAAGLFMAQIASKNYSAEKTILYPSLFVIGAVCFYFIYDAIALGTDPWQLVKNYIAATGAEFVKQYSQLPLGQENIDLVKNNEKEMVSGFIQIFPSLVVIMSTVTVWLNFLLGKNYLAKAGLAYPKLSFLAGWKAPDHLIWLFIISGGLFFLPQKDINFLSLNVFLVVCLLYFLQGMAVASFLFQVKNVPVFFRSLFYFLIAVQQLLVIAITAIGLFDIWVDFRKFIQKNQTTD